MGYRLPSNSSEDNNHLSQFFSVDREEISIRDFNLPSFIFDNARPFQGNFDPTTQALADAFVSSGLSQLVAESTFFLSGNILDMVFT